MDLLQFSDQLHKIRRNLLLVNSIILVIISQNIEIKGIEYSGLKITGLGTETIKLILLILLIYFFISFLWTAINELQKWDLNFIHEIHKGIDFPIKDRGREKELTKNKKHFSIGVFESIQRDIKTSERIRTRLSIFKWSAKLRIAVLEFGLPIVLSLISITTLAPSIYSALVKTS